MFRSRVLSILFVVVFLFSVFTPAALANAQPQAGTALAAPAGFSKSSPGDKTTTVTTRITLQWDPSATTGVTYEYCVFANKQSCPPGQYKSVGGNLSITVILKPDTNYIWQVRARAADGSVTYANEGTYWRFKTGTAAPHPFSKFGPTSGSLNQPTSVTVSWTASEGVNVNYQVCYDTTNDNLCGSTWQLAGAGTSFTINGLNYSTTYYWQVRAYNSKGTVYANGSASSYWNFRTQAAPPAPFAKLTPKDGAVGIPLNETLIWSPSSGESITYEYCIAENPATSPCKTSNTGWISTGANIWVTPPGLQYNKTYYWQVRALSGGSATTAVEANSGAWWSFSTLTAEPASFMKILPGNNDLDVSLTPYLYWSSAGAGFTYEYCLIPANVPAHPHCEDRDYQKNGASTSVLIDTALSFNTPYLWQVRAQEGNGPYLYPVEGEWTFTTLPEPPSVSLANRTFTTPEDPSPAYTAHINATNPSGKTLIYFLSGRAPAGNFRLDSNGDFTFTPEANFNGSVTFDFTVWDGVNNPVGPLTATITVTAVNDPPVIVPIENVSVYDGEDVFFTIETYDYDLPYGDSLTLTLLGTLPTGATFTVSKDATTGATSGDFDWPAAAFSPTHPGPYQFTARLSDGHGDPVTDPFTVSFISNTVYLPFIMKK